jgi:hypothetical protein
MYVTRPAAWTFIAGYGAANVGEIATVEKAEARLRALRERLQAGGDAYAAKGLTIIEWEVAPVRKLAQGEKDGAVKFAKDAADLELTMAPPSGPPEPIQPAVELYAEMLVSTGRATGRDRRLRTAVGTDPEPSTDGARP